ncbi:MAG TPA: DUF2924 domain-containing protein [Gammaproteobacteria bacterium]|nr:DUF2924 domain-containing protein [Gammaproteobacteria bacterium]
MAEAENLITGLDALSRPGLSTRFKDLFGRPAPKGMSRPLLLRIVAYRVQEQAAGGPNRALRQRLARLAREFKATGSISDTPAPQIKPGTQILREWQGDTHTVTVTDGGFQYRNKTYKSLSVIAREITGTRWSGPAFFGLRARTKTSAEAHGR